jgi:hypothetical protein
MITNLMRTRQAHNLTSRQVADQAGLPLHIEYTAEIGGPVEEEDASKIADALSVLAGKCYTLETLGLTLKKKEKK